MEHCPYMRITKFKIHTFWEVRNLYGSITEKKQDCIADLFYNYQNCTEKRKNFWNDLRESLVKSYKSSVVSGRFLWYNGKIAEKR